MLKEKYTPSQFSICFLPCPPTAFSTFLLLLMVGQGIEGHREEPPLGDVARKNVELEVWRMTPLGERFTAEQVASNALRPQRAFTPPRRAPPLTFLLLLLQVVWAKDWDEGSPALCPIPISSS